MLLSATLLFNTCHTIKTMWVNLFHIRTDQKLLVKQHMVQERLKGSAIMSTERILALGVDTEHYYKPHETHFLKRWATAFFQRDLDLLIGCCANLLEVIPMSLLVFAQSCCEKQQYFYKLTPRCELWFTSCVHLTIWCVSLRGNIVRPWPSAEAWVVSVYIPTIFDLLSCWLDLVSLICGCWSVILKSILAS